VGKEIKSPRRIGQGIPAFFGFQGMIWERWFWMSPLLKNEKRRRNNMKYVLGYLGVGLILLIGTLFVNKKFKLRIFWEYDPWAGWSRNGIEFFILLGWPLAVAISSIAGLLYLIYRACTIFIGEEHPEDKPEKEPENKREKELYNHLLSQNVDKSDAAAIAKELVEIGLYAKEQKK
jgi:hypothetical protein